MHRESSTRKPPDSPATLRPYLLARCEAVGARTYTGISNKRLLAHAIAKEHRLSAGRLMPECFGVRFAAPDDPACAACKVQVMCLHMAANKTLLRAQDASGAKGVGALAEAMTIEPKSVLFMQQAAVALGTLEKAALNSTTPNPTPSHLVDKLWPLRFLKERLRHPYLERLPEGTVLRRNYDGRDHLIAVGRGYYEHDGKRHPTLYDVAMAITGAKVYQRTNPGQQDKLRACSNFSVRRFFWKSIDEAMPEL